MTNVTEAIRSRRSCRAFAPLPIERELIAEILDIAARAPSGGNLQPWHVDVVAGTALDELKARARAAIGHGLQPTEFNVYPPQISEPDARRRRACGEALYESIGIARADKPARWTQFLHNYELFGARVGLFFSLDRVFDRPQWAHLGMFMQNIMLLAEERGLATCPQEAWAALHETVSEFLELPQDRIFYCGIAIGHADQSHPINQFRTEREPVETFARFRGL
jgi:nitroreductase